MLESGIELCEGYPKSSPDHNAIENAWALLRNRLHDTFPAAGESRAHFLRRLRAAVAWVNKHHKKTLLYLGHNQKERAQDVLDNSGNRTEW